MLLSGSSLAGAFDDSLWRSPTARGSRFPRRSGFSPPPPISYRGVKLPEVSAALGRFELRHEADLPQEGSLREDFRRRPGPWGPSPLPMFARHEYRARARNKWAIRGAARRWCRKLKSQVAGQAESRSARLPVRHLVGEFVGIGQAVAHRLGIDRLGSKRPSARCADTKATIQAPAISILFIRAPS
jgi:hypothetical protein